MLQATKAESESPAPTPTENEECVRDCISIMLRQERRCACRDYVRGDGNWKRAFAAHRGRVFRWIRAVVDAAGLRRETAVVAMSHLDRFLSSNSPRAERARRNLRDYRLVATTCLYVAAKTNETVGLDLAALTTALTGCSGGALTITAQSIVACERDVLASLRWRLSCPTPMQFASCILELLPSDDHRDAVASELVRDIDRLAEVAIEDYACVILRRSSIAMACTLNSLENVPQDLLSPIERARFLRRVAVALEIDSELSWLIELVRGRLASTI